MDVSKFSHLIIGRGWFLMKTYGGPKLLSNRLINWSKSKNNNSESSKSHINLVLSGKPMKEPIQRKNHYRRNSYNNLLTKLLKLDSLYVTSANVPLAIYNSGPKTLEFLCTNILFKETSFAIIWTTKINNDLLLKN